MDYILFGAFSFITLAFIPLFITIMMKLKRNYEQIYQRVKCKLSVVFIVYIIFLIGRLILFADIKLSHFLFENINLYEAVPVYITEIVITLMLSYVLFSISSNKTKPLTMEQQRRQTNFMTVDVRLQSFQVDESIANEAMLYKGEERGIYRLNNKDTTIDASSMSSKGNRRTVEKNLLYRDFTG
jgi:Na+/proline symporter